MNFKLKQLQVENLKFKLNITSTSVFTLTCFMKLMLNLNFKLKFSCHRDGMTWTLPVCAQLGLLSATITQSTCHQVGTRVPTLFQIGTAV